MKNIITVLFALFVIAGCDNAQTLAPAAAPANAVPAAPAPATPAPAPVVIPIDDSPAAPATSVTTGKGITVHTLPGGGYLLEGKRRDYVVPPPSSCSTGGCSGAPPPPPPPPPPGDSIDKAASEECTIGWCLFQNVASWIGAVGAFLLEIGLGLALLLLLIGGAFYGLRRLRERRHDRKWHRRSAHLRGRYRAAIVARNGTTDPVEQVRWARRIERRWASYTGHLEIEENPVDDESDLPPPPPLADAAEDAAEAAEA